MDTKLCRICGKLSENYVHIFKTEGLKNKIETCLPIIVSPHCLLPDTICSECLENVDNFYSFIKNCLQNIIVLEAQYDIMESCLKTKRKHEKGSLTDFCPVRYDKNIQTDEDFTDLLLNKEENLHFTANALHFNYLEVEKLSAALLNAENILNGKEPDALVPTSIINIKPDPNPSFALVNYDVESEAESENEENGRNIGKVVLMPKTAGKNKVKPQTAIKNKSVCLQKSRSLDVDGLEYSYGHRTQKKYFDDAENDLISEIAQRKDLKRKSDSVLPHRTKIFKIDTSSRRKNRQPKKVEYANKTDCSCPPNLTFNNLEQIYEEMEKKSSNTSFTNSDKLQDHVQEDKFVAMQQVKKEITNALPQLCLLCDVQFTSPTTLAAHVYEMHGIDMAQVISSEPIMERKKKIPNLVKIADLKSKNDIQDGSKDQSMEEPPTLQPTFVCPICPAVLTNRSDLFTHLKMKHGKQAALQCGLCLHISTSYTNLTSHLENCRQQHNINSKYVCKICSYHDDNSKAMENHVAVHDFILVFCKKQAKMFDPCDYIEVNPGCENANKLLTCTECNQGGFVTFKEFSTHRRSQHQIFHCDLCNKFYGRNSHLWKHVNRLHKGHPSITCQLCYKTSASKYHLAQHFNKIHSAKPFKQKQTDTNDDHAENFMSQKFQGFDFQSVRQSFMRQELLEQERKFAPISLSDEGNSDGDDSELFNKDVNMKLNVKQEVKTETTTQEMECSDSEVYINDPDEYESKDMPETKPNLSSLNIVAETKVKKEQPSMSPPKEIDASSDLYTNIITNYTPPQNEGEYKCPKCFKGFHKRMLLKKHKKNCRPRLQKDLLTRCKTCSRIFKDRQSLTKHLINYHSEYACEICGQKVQSKCEIVSHIRFSHPSCHLFCHCGNILRSKVDLLEHKSDHRNSFVCQFCGDMLPTKIKLKMHILSLHRKILSLSCGICLKLFETQHILRDHVRLVHKDELSPLTSCTVCGKNYGSKWKTYDHLNKSHGRIFKACKACLDIFDTEEELQAHFETTHINVSQSKSSAAGQTLPNATNSPSLNATNVNTSVAKKEAYDSDAEQIPDENDDKNSSSEYSNDGDAFSHYQNTKVEPNLSEEEEAVLPTKLQDFPEIAGQESRISLLEKRLLGSRRSIEGDSSVVTVTANFLQDKASNKNKLNAQNSTVVQKKTKENYETPPMKQSKDGPKEKKSLKVLETPNTGSTKRDTDADLDSNSAQNPLQNSSKRTVYVNSNDPSLCEICLKTWPAKKHLWQHYIRCHKTVAATVCGICLKTNDNYKLLQAHLRENHPTLLHGQGFGSNFICRICGRYHNASSKLKLHMAIHENFDWSILDHFPVSNTGGGLHRNLYPYDGQISKGMKSKEATNNGYLEESTRERHESLMYMGSQLYVEAANHENEDINYESLIEQVECSSDSENDSDIEECAKDSKYLENHETINSSSGDESDNESVISVSEENSLESQMLQNMLKEKFATGQRPNSLTKASHDEKIVGSGQKGNNTQEPFHFENRNLSLEKCSGQGVTVKREYSSSDSDETSDSNQTVSDTEVEILDDAIQVKSSSDEDSSQFSRISQISERCGSKNSEIMRNTPKHLELVNQNSKSNCEMENASIFVRKSEELDSAIRSISYEQITNVDEQIDVDICEIQPQTLNQHEIQSAVDSIL